jgi:hypothetical protein
MYVKKYECMVNGRIIKNINIKNKYKNKKNFKK